MKILQKYVQTTQVDYQQIISATKIYLRHKDCALHNIMCVSLASCKSAFILRLDYEAVSWQFSLLVVENSR